MAKLSAPSGFRDFLPEQYRKRAELIARIRRVYEAFGYEGMETPALENLSVFQGKAGDENEKLMFLVQKRGDAFLKALHAMGNVEREAHSEKYDADSSKEERLDFTEKIASASLADMGLRFDLTVPLARYYASHRGELPKVFKRYQIGPVWRAERPQHGRFREFIQCDIDVLGSDSMLVEADVILATATVLAELGFAGLTVRLNARPLLRHIVRAAGVAGELVAGACVSLDKLDKVTVVGVKKELEERGIAADAALALIAFYEKTRAGRNEELLAAVERYLSEERRYESLTEAHAQLANIREILRLTPPLPSGTLAFDPFLARGMDYYTGPIFEVAAEGVPFSLAGGGRFDGLVDKIAGGKPGAPTVPACGFSIGFERVFTIMEERGMFAGAAAAADVLIAVPNDEAAPEALKLGAELRQAGLRVDVHPAAGKPVPQFELAEKKGIRFAIVADPEKLKSGVLEVRELATRKNTSVPRGELAKWLLERRV